ncbi:MAG: DNA-protecting protein DprA [Ruminococcus sp.]|nr:DNA-protecting protein DprA [Ruminococcus sp.]
MDETKYWLWLTMVFGTGNRRIWEAVSLFGGAKETYFALTDGGHDLELTENEAANVTKVDMSRVTDHISQCGKMNISLVCYGSPEYPAQLRHIFNPPAVLYYKGNISCLNGRRTVTAVGTRRASDYGLNAAYRICGELAGSGLVIVSGFALGTDITAHMAAVEHNSPTACVMGCGLDVDYPKDNFRFRDSIITNGGVFVSEYPPGTPPHPQNFPKRNRILAGLGYVAVVFEASIKSGSLITADLAAAQGREVFCLPPADIFSNAFSGNTELLKNGANALYSAQDIVDCFRIGGALDSEIRSEDIAAISSFGYERSKNTDGDELINGIKTASRKAGRRKDKKAAAEKKSAAEKDVKEKTENTSRDDLTELQQRICGLISSGTVHADAIAGALDIDAAELMMEFTELEVMGVIRSLPGKMFEINE